MYVCCKRMQQQQVKRPVFVRGWLVAVVVAPELSQQQNVRVHVYDRYMIDKLPFPLQKIIFCAAVYCTEV